MSSGPRPGRGPAGGFGRMRQPAGAPATPQHAAATTARIVRLLRPDRARIVLVFAFAATSVALTVSGPRILGNATNEIFDGVVSKALPAGATKAQVIAELRAHGHSQLATMLGSMQLDPGRGVDFNALGRTLGLATIVYVCAAVFSLLQGYLMAGVAQRAMYRMRSAVEEKLSRLPLTYFDTHAHGDILSRVTNDIDNLTTTLQQGLSQLVTSLLTIVGVLGMMFWISPPLAGVSLIVVPLSVVTTLAIARRSQPEFTAQWDRTGLLNGHIEETYSGHRLVQVYGRTDAAVDVFDEQNEKLYKASFRAQFFSGVIQPAIQLLTNLNYVAIAAIGGWQVATGTLSLGDVTAFIQYSRQFTMPLTQTASQMNLLQSGVASAERVFELLDAPEELPDPGTPLAVDHPTGRVALEHVGFRYRPDIPLISDFTLEAAPGETVAIVGPTGAGKTTIVNLLMRFYEVDSGRITLDGVPITSMSRDALRRTFGMVLQDTWLFAGSIHDNIAYGREGATSRQVLDAARAAHVDRFVQTLADGYDTVLDEDASNISAGQRQLITIARAFLADPAILILDEATSSVDTRTEVLIQHAMARLRTGRTSFVIAHRLSTIRNADAIVVMEHGQIVEQGSHDELISRGGAYANLYESQFAGAFTGAG